jgi:hypothetical protein
MEYLNFVPDSTEKVGAFTFGIVVVVGSSFAALNAVCEQEIKR